MNWLRNEIYKRLGIKGHIVKARNNPCYQLRFAKKESLIIIDKLYYPNAVCLSRKLLKIKTALSIINR
jgi:hypothetical protein